MLLGAFFFSQFATWILFLFLIIFQVFWQAALVIFGIRLLLQYLVIYRSAKKLDEVDLVWMFPVLELFLVCMQFYLFVRNLFSKPRLWK